MSLAFASERSPRRAVSWSELFAEVIEVLKQSLAWESRQASGKWFAASASEEAPFIIQWIQLSLQGDGEAFRQLMNHYQAVVAARMWKFSRDRLTHQELVQDVFVEVFLSLANYNASAPFEHWLQRIATRVGYRYWKSRKAAATMSDEQLYALARHQEDGANSAQEAGELVHHLLARLSPEDRLVITLMSLEEYTVAETARLTGWNQTLVKVRAHRARRKLEDLWRKFDGGEAEAGR